MIIQKTIFNKKLKPKRELKEHEIDKGDNGIYNKKNKLNDLTGREWKFSTKTVINKVYPLNYHHELRKQHGGQKPPELCADIIKIFTKKNDLVLDPFMGVGGTLIGASISNRQAHGIEINKKWIDIYHQVCRLDNLSIQKTTIGDSKKELLTLKEESVDFVLTDVPYWDMDKEEKTRSKKSNASNLNKFNNLEKQSKEDWLDEMYKIFKETERVLKNNKYMAIFIGDMYKNNRYHILSAELAQKLSADSLVLKSNIIWYDVSKSIHIYGYPSTYIPSLIHQNILIFKKEK